MFDVHFAVVFWILAIDQNLHAPFSTLVKLYVKDPNGISQAVWEDIPLFEGKFTIAITQFSGIRVFINFNVFHEIELHFYFW